MKNINRRGLDVINRLIELDTLVDMDVLGSETQLLPPAAVESIRTDDGLSSIPVAAHTNVLLIERSLQPGDVLEVEGHMSVVENVQIRATRVRTLNTTAMVLVSSCVC